MNGWTLFEIGINAYQAFLAVYFVRQRFHLVKPQLRYAWIAGAAVCGALSVYLFIEVPFPDTVLFLIPLGYTWFASDEKWYCKIFWNVVLAAVLLGLTNLMINVFMLLYDTAWEEIMSETSLRIAFVVSLNIALLAVLFPIARFKKRTLDGLSRLPLVVFVLALVVDLVMIEILYSMRAHWVSPEVSGFFSAVSVLLLFACLLTLALYEIMSASAVKHQKTEMELRKAQLSREQYREGKEIYAYMASYQHDLKHQLTLMQTLVAQGQAQKAGELYNRMAVPQASSLRFQTGNIAVDALLTAKNHLMDQHNIRFDYQPYPLQELPIDESDFCVMLANLLDNAIEAVQQLDEAAGEKAIHLKMARSWDVLFVSCRNPTQSDRLQKAGPRFLSTKKEKIGHGFGISNIRRTVDAADGQCSFAADAHAFVVEIALPFQTKS